MIYSTTNLIDIYTLSAVSTEDPLYVKEFLYDNRPSRPFRFQSKTNQSILVDLSIATRVTLAAIFNHTLTAAATARIQANSSNAWGGGLPYNWQMSWREHDQALRFSQNERWWRFLISDPANLAMPEIGVAWLGTWAKFNKVRITPGRSDSPEIFQVEQVTTYGQDWSTYLSTGQSFELALTNQIDPATIDELQTFLEGIQGAAGRFVFIPDEKLPHVYLVKVVGNPTSKRTAYGTAGELRNWTMKLKVLTRGITLL